MDRQEYINSNGRFPVSTDTFDFIQDQIELVASITAMFGQNVIISRPGVYSFQPRGLAILNGDLLPIENTNMFSITVPYYLDVIETKQNIVADGVTYENVRTVRTARYRRAYIGTPPNHVITVAPTGCVASVSSDGIVDLYDANLTTMAKTAYEQILPKGAIIIWSGSLNAIPTGYALCDGNNNVAINGVTIPDLRGKFVVGYDASSADYNVIGNAGGSATHTLTVAEMPSHSHEYVDTYFSENVDANEGLLGSNSNTDNDNQALTMNRTTSPTGGGQAFDNRPPYYTLAYLIKTI